MKMQKSKKFKIFILTAVSGLIILITGFFAYTAIDMFDMLRSSVTSGDTYSLKRSGMILFNGNSGIKLTYPSMSVDSSGTFFYLVFILAALFAAASIIFMYVYFYRLIEVNEYTEKSLRSLEKNVLEIPSTIIHEIKGNINSIMINSRILTEKIKNSEFKKKDEITKTGCVIEDEISKIAFTIDGILKFTKDLDLNLEEVNLSELIKEACEPIKSGFSMKKIKFSSSVDKNINIVMDKDLMVQAFKNLILNAAESYGGRNGDVLIHSSYVLNKVCLTVEDYGCGIEKKELNKIFEPFWTTKKNGVGLGLPLIKRIADAHKFDINIESRIGFGTKVSLIMKEIQ